MQSFVKTSQLFWTMGSTRKIDADYTREVNSACVGFALNFL